MIGRVADFISRYELFTPGQRVGVAVSGGADSVCLLHVLLELASRWALKLSVLHLDHRIRGEESAGDAGFVRELAGRLALPLHAREVDVPGLQAESRGNLEQAAREARRAFFLECLSNGLVERVATGHTRTDQAETVLFRLLRGSGTAGLAGILPVTREGIVRPLLDVERGEVEALLRERGIGWREDLTNRDLGYARNRIRHKLLPELAKDWNPALTKVLAQTAALARDEELYWEPLIADLSRKLLTRRGNAVLLSAEALRGQPPPVARRLIRRAVEEAKGDLRRLDFGHVEDILRLAGERQGHGRIMAPGLDVLRSFDRLRMAPAESLSAPARNYRTPLVAPGLTDAPDGSVRLLTTLSGAKPAGGLDWDRLPRPLELRNWRPGDQYRPVGEERAERIKSMFQEHKIPLWERRTWPVVTGGGTIVWSRQFGPAAEYAAGPDSRLALSIEEAEPDRPA